MHWVSREAYAPPPNALADDEPGILEHMNTDHAHTMADYCRLQNITPKENPIMVGIDSDGFDLNVDGKLVRFDFDAPVTDATAVRAALVALAHQARST